MKQLRWKIRVIRISKKPLGIMFPLIPCKLTAWGIMFGAYRIQWRDSYGWIWRTGKD